MHEGTENYHEDIEFLRTLEDVFRGDLVALTPGDQEEDNVLSEWFLPKLVGPMGTVFFGVSLWGQHMRLELTGCGFARFSDPKPETLNSARRSRYSSTS